MPGSGAKTYVLRKSNLFFLSGCLSFVFLITGHASVHAQASSEVNAIICGTGSYINIISPASDSIVTDSTLILKGAVQQASQVEIRIDGGYDGIIPIDSTQLTYEAPIHLVPGTHTVELKAIDSCGTTDSRASTVVTYTPAPSTASDGSTTPTTTDGVTIGEPQESVNQTGAHGLLPPPVIDAWESLLNWLNITSTDTSSGSAPQLSLLRALTIASGTYLATFGLAATIVNTIASTTPFKSISSSSHRSRVVSRLSRGIGVILLLAGFFL